MKAPDKIRLDKLLVEKGLVSTRERARSIILSGAVLVGDRVVDKAGTLVGVDEPLRLTVEELPYVSRGGLKLEGALETFQISVAGAVALDVGVSTGGFTDCLLQQGARKVYAVDVGYGQLAWKLRQDNRVILFERTNIRYFTGEEITEDVTIAVIDVSFISLKLVLPVVLGLVSPGADVLALVKPQFEAGRGEIGKKGVVRDSRIHERVVAEIAAYAEGLGLAILGTCDSRPPGPKGNREFFLYAKK